MKDLAIKLRGLVEQEPDDTSLDDQAWPNRIVPLSYLLNHLKGLMGPEAAEELELKVKTPQRLQPAAISDGDMLEVLTDLYGEDAASEILKPFQDIEAWEFD